MIIERKYEYFYRLIERDSKAKALYEKACENKDKDFEKRVYEYNLYRRAFEIDMGSGISNPRIIWDGFEELDKEEPYDNGFTLNDVTDVGIMNRGGYDTDAPWMNIAYIKEDGDLKHIVMVDHKEQKLSDKIRNQDPFVLEEN